MLIHALRSAIFSFDTANPRIKVELGELNMTYDFIPEAFRASRARARTLRSLMLQTSLFFSRDSRRDLRANTITATDLYTFTCTRAYCSNYKSTEQTQIPPETYAKAFSLCLFIKKRGRFFPMFDEKDTIKPTAYVTPGNL